MICVAYKKNLYPEEYKTKLKIFGIILYQYIFIILFVWIGFSFDWNKGIKYSDTANSWLLSIASIGIFVICCHFLCLFSDPEESVCCIIYHILYLPIMIIYYYSFSRIIEEKYILGFLFIIFFVLLSIVLFILFSRSKNPCYIFLIGLSVSAICILFFHFLWLKSNTALISLIILLILIDIYLAVLLGVTEEYFKKNFILSVVAFDYGFFALILYLIYIFCKCIDYCCKYH